LLRYGALGWDAGDGRAGEGRDKSHDSLHTVGGGQDSGTLYGDGSGVGATRAVCKGILTIRLYLPVDDADDGIVPPNGHIANRWQVQE